MDAIYLFPLYLITLCLLGLHFLISLLKKHFWTKVVLVISFVSSLLSVIAMTIVSGHVPVAGDFEKLQTIAFYLICIGLIQQSGSYAKACLSGSFSFFAFLVMLIIPFGRMEVAENYLIYSKPEIVLFFQFRMLSMAFFLYSLSLFFDAYLHVVDNQFFANKLRLARNFVILGAAFFLGGEFFGSIWSLNGWGDPWRWSKSFFMASVMFFLSMLALHIPISFMKTAKHYVVVPALPIFAILIVYLF